VGGGGGGGGGTEEVEGADEEEAEEEEDEGAPAEDEDEDEAAKAALDAPPPPEASVSSRGLLSEVPDESWPISCRKASNSCTYVFSGIGSAPALPALAVAGEHGSRAVLSDV